MNTTLHVRYPIRICAALRTTLTEVCHGFSQSLNDNATILTEVCHGFPQSLNDNAMITF